MHRSRLLFFVTCCLLLAVSNGCSDGRPKRVPVSGQVLIDGQPLTHGYVRFVPKASRPSKGNLDSQGKFTLYCYEPGDGAVLGIHQVEVSGMQSISEWESRWHAPKHYANVQTSGLTQEITQPTSELTIELTWDGKQPFTEIDESARPPKGVKSWTK